MKILVSGSTGFIGSSLIPFLQEKGCEVLKLVRVRGDLASDEIGWDPHRGVINPPLLEGIDGVIHLAGESISGRWTPDKKKKIYSSRVEGTKLLCNSLNSLKKSPSVMVCASAIGYYGSRGDEILTEESSRGEGFLSDVCFDWENATNCCNTRVVNARFGVVLSPKGGALKQMLPVFKMGLGGKLGSGKQWMSWVALEDVLRTLYFSLTSKLSGPLNIVSPDPVTNAAFTKTLGEILYRPTFMTVPSWAVKWALGEMGEQLLLSSQRVVPDKLEKAGFKFSYLKIASLKDDFVPTLET